MKTRKTKTGWNIVDSPNASPAPAVEVVQEAPKVVGLELDFSTLVELHVAIFGDKYRWRLANEALDQTGAVQMSPPEKLKLIEATLGDLSLNTENVRSLVAGLNKLGGFRLLNRIAHEWLFEHGAGPAVTNERTPEFQAMTDDFNRRVNS
jgi:hypothetical protein